MENCTMTHDLKEIKGDIKRHDQEIVALKLDIVEFKSTMVHLMKKMDTLTSWFQKIFYLGLVTGLSFIIWFIQNY